MKGQFILLYFLFTNLLFAQFLSDFVNNKLVPDINKYNLGKSLIVYATDYKKTILLNYKDKLEVDTLSYLDEDINLLLAAISIKLFDEERFNIHSKLTALIPGSTEPYLPDSDDYELPFKNEMTGNDLITQRSGIFNINNLKFSDNYIFADTNYISIIDSIASFISKNKLFFIDPNVTFNYNKFNYFLLSKILDRILGGKVKEELENNGRELLQQSTFTLKSKLFPYQLALYYRNIIKNEKIIDKKLINNYLLYALPINNYFVEYAAGSYYFKNIGYGNISEKEAYIKITLYIPLKDIFLIFFVKAEKTDDENILENETIEKITEMLSKIKVN